MTAAALTVVLVASLTQVVASPLVASASASASASVVRRDLPLMTSAPAPASDLKRAEPPQPKADFAPLAGKPASKEQVRAGEAAPETSWSVRSMRVWCPRRRRR
ncbi:hypothetical protein ABR738_23575 [Streptomyces sp. Edi4]|uniref:hypothetical protein n=1 Tax=Streptomyces sp. Edi4 TaxID=3162527 RepID=UPI003305CC82